MLWFMLLAVALLFIFVHGIEYVSWPRLVPVTDVVHYSGPGFRSGHGGKGFALPAWPPAKRVRAGSEEIEMGMKKRVD